jgi:serine/threonine-protein kinase HipA
MVFESTKLIKVYLWGQYVGALAQGTRSRAYVFEYTPEWLRTGIEFAPLTMPSRARTYTFPGLPAETFYGLPSAIADSLPDRFGNSIVTAELQRQGASAESVSALDRLAYAGSRSMGALEFIPDSGPGVSESSMLNIGELVSVARNVVAGRIGTKRESEAALQQILAVGTSAGGARAKAVVNFDPETGVLHPGQQAVSGLEPWLLKFDGVGLDKQLGASQVYGRIEYAYSLMAKAAGVNMAQTRLLEENGRAHFMTRRFDRLDDLTKLHMQSLCGLSQLDYNALGVHDYAQYQLAIVALGLGEGAAVQGFCRMAFNVAVANCDDHAKNFGFLMNSVGQWSLAPAYDVTHAFNPQGPWTFQHLMSVSGKFQGITREDLTVFAERHNVPGALPVLNQINDAVDSWAMFASSAKIPPQVSDTIAKDFQRV